MWNLNDWHPRTELCLVVVSSGRARYLSFDNIEECESRSLCIRKFSSPYYETLADVFLDPLTSTKYLATRNMPKG